MCPSLLQDRLVDRAQADVFSLGMTTYAMAMGVTLEAEEYNEVKATGLLPDSGFSDEVPALFLLSCCC